MSGAGYWRFWSNCRAFTSAHPTHVNGLFALACGYYARARSGGFCRQRTANGTPSSNVSRAGARMGLGIKSSDIFPKPPIYKMFPWMGRSSGHTPVRQGRQTAPPRKRRWGVPKAALAVRSMRSVMPWGYPSDSSWRAAKGRNAGRRSPCWKTSTPTPFWRTRPTTPMPCGSGWKPGASKPSFRLNRTGKDKLTAIIAIIRSDTSSNVCLASSNTTAGLPPDMRKRPLITGGCCHLPLYSYGYDEMSTEPKPNMHDRN